MDRSADVAVGTACILSGLALGRWLGPNLTIKSAGVAMGLTGAAALSAQAERRRRIKPATALFAGGASAMLFAGVIQICQKQIPILVAASKAKDFWQQISATSWLVNGGSLGLTASGFLAYVSAQSLKGGGGRPPGGGRRGEPSPFPASPTSGGKSAGPGPSGNDIGPTPMDPSRFNPADGVDQPGEEAAERIVDRIGSEHEGCADKAAMAQVESEWVQALGLRDRTQLWDETLAQRFNEMGLDTENDLRQNGILNPLASQELSSADAADEKKEYGPEKIRANLEEYRLRWEGEHRNRS